MKKKVLYIEDNPGNIRLVRKMLKLLEYEVVEAANGFGGLAAAECEKPDVIVLDINLPDIDGFEVARRLKKSAYTAHIPIIALTADSTNKRQCMEAGCSEYLNKPVSTASLVRAVQSFANRASLPS
jgi:CheY-like chemotaxis protein